MLEGRWSFPLPPGRKGSRLTSSAEQGWRSALRAAGVSVPPAPAPLLGAILGATPAQLKPIEKACRDLLDEEPEHREALDALHWTLKRLGKLEEATEVRKRSLLVMVGEFDLHADESTEVLRYLLGREGLGPAPASVPAAYLRRLFDGCAAEYDRLLVEQLGYRAHKLLRDLFDGVCGTPTGGLAVADLGCGTGLAGRELKPWARRLVGVDLSPGILAVCAARGLHDALEEAELCDWLARPGEPFDLLLAADVFNYLGDLEPVFAAARTRVRPPGWLLFSVELGQLAPYELQPTGRYAHAPSALDDLAARTGWVPVEERPAPLRREQDADVPGLLALWRADLPPEPAEG